LFESSNGTKRQPGNMQGRRSRFGDGIQSQKQLSKWVWSDPSVLMLLGKLPSFGLEVNINIYCNGTSGPDPRVQETLLPLLSTFELDRVAGRYVN